jgi:hypothetical protein
MDPGRISCPDGQGVTVNDYPNLGKPVVAKRKSRCIGELTIEYSII